MYSDLCSCWSWWRLSCGSFRQWRHVSRPRACLPLVGRCTCGCSS